jgi:hypothetical protein
MVSGQIIGLDRLGLFYGDGTLFTDFNAAFASETLFSIHWFGFTVFHFEDLHRANIHTLFATDTFLFVHNGIKRHFVTSPFM